MTTYTILLDDRGLIPIEQREPTGEARRVEVFLKNHRISVQIFLSDTTLEYTVVKGNHTEFNTTDLR